MKNRNIKKIVGISAAVLLVLILAATSIVVVPAGHTGVLVRLGAVQDTV